MKKIKYPKKKNQTDMSSLSILFKKDQKRYQKLACSMKWVTCKK